MSKTYDNASQVGAEDGQVIVDGPDGVAVTLTPEAAAETGDRLIEQAAEAHGQTVREKGRKKERRELGLQDD